MLGELRAQERCLALSCSLRRETLGLKALGGGVKRVRLGARRRLCAEGSVTQCSVAPTAMRFLHVDGDVAVPVVYSAAVLVPLLPAGACARAAATRSLPRQESAATWAGKAPWRRGTARRKRALRVQPLTQVCLVGIRRDVAWLRAGLAHAEHGALTATSVLCPPKGPPPPPQPNGPALKTTSMSSCARSQSSSSAQSESE